MRKKAIWLVLCCTLTVVALLMSCAPSPPPTEEEPSTPSQEKPPPAPQKEEKPAPTVEQPKYGGTFVECRVTAPLIFSEEFGNPGSAVTEYLTNEELMTGDWAKGPAGTAETSWIYLMMPPPKFQTGSLATGWELSDPNTLVYHIRKGIHFHNKPPVNGREMTADDVVFSFKRYWETPTAYLYTAYPWKTHIESITAPDKWTVVIKCLPGKAGFVYEMASDHARIIPREVVEKYGDINKWENSCGTGSFMLVDYVVGSSSTLLRNPDYWMKDPVHPNNQLPYLDRVKQLYIPDVSTRMAALRTGKVDQLGGHDAPVGWEDADSLMKTNPELKWVGYPGELPASIHMRVDKPELPFKDLKVRRALAMGIDRKAIADKYYGGRAEILTWPIMPIPEFMDIYTPLDKLPAQVQELFKYQPDKAKQLLSEAGYPNGFKTKIICTSGSVDLLSIVKDYWVKIGVDLEIQVKEPGAFTSIYSARAHEQMIIFEQLCTMPFKFLYTRPQSVYNFSRIDDPKINEAIDAITNAYLDEPKRRQMMKEIAPYMLEQAYCIQLPAYYRYVFWQPWLKGYHGEIRAGYTHFSDWPKYVWYDQELKYKMTGSR